MAPLDPADVRAVYLACLPPVVELLADELLDAHWDEPSSLVGLTTGALAAHLARSATRPLVVMERRTSVAPVATTPGGYYRAIDLTGDLDSEINTGIRQRADTEARAGPAAIHAAVAAAAGTLATTVPALELDAVIEAFADLPIPFSVYLETRVLEIVVHVDDLLAGLPTLPGELPAAAWTVATEVALDVARSRSGDRALLRTMVRGERAEPDVFPTI